MKNQNYRPRYIQFEVATNQAPENLGTFENAQAAIKFVADNLICLNEKITASRHMDAFEKDEIRQEYQNLLENKLPFYKKDLQKAEISLKAVKDAVKALSDAVSSIQSEIEGLGVQVKIGTTEINLDDNYTWRVAFNDKYHYYTYIDREIRLAKIKEMTISDKTDIYNDQSKNTTTLEKLLKRE